MKPHLIVAIGGTGQVILHFYAQQYLTGLVRVPFHAVVVDTAPMLPSLVRLGQTFSDLAQVSAPDSLPSIAYHAVPLPPGQNIYEVLSGHSSPLPGVRLLPSGLFERSDLEQTVAGGLYARPALSAVVGLPSFARDLSFGGVERVLTISSLVGGTGGGLTAGVLSALSMEIERQHADNASLRALFVGQYFRPDLNIVRDADRRFPSNERLGALTLSKLAPRSLNQYCVVRPATLVERNATIEAEANHLALPAENSPIWDGLKAIRELMAQAAAPVGADFLQKERSYSGVELSVETVETEMRSRVRLAHSLVSKRVVKSMAREPHLDRVWGLSLPSMVARAFGAIQSNPNLEELRPAFAQNLQSSLERQWGQLRTVFPRWALAPGSVSPNRLKENGWRDNAFRFDQSEAVAGNAEDAMRIVATALLFRSLRKD